MNPDHGARAEAVARSIVPRASVPAPLTRAATARPHGPSRTAPVPAR